MLKALKEKARLDRALGRALSPQCRRASTISFTATPPWPAVMRAIFGFGNSDGTLRELSGNLWKRPQIFEGNGVIKVWHGLAEAIELSVVRLGTEDRAISLLSMQRQDGLQAMNQRCSETCVKHSGMLRSNKHRT